MWIILLILGMTSLHGIECQCTFPATLTGTWVSSNDGTWDINSTHLLNYYSVSSTTGITISPGVSQLNFECFENRGDTKYVIKSEEFTLLGGQRSIHTCIDIRQTTDNKLVYYQATQADPFGYQFTIQDVYDNVCNTDSYVQPYNYHIALKSGSETSELQKCPADCLDHTIMTTCIDVNSNSTSLKVLDANDQRKVGPIPHLKIYNRDSTAPDNNNYYRFVCLVVVLSGGVVYVTASPKD
ncbi:uncharacterized protein LOC132723360, partial [Ruditapes philippinarum]|uniref:uncharacterized protein LOC132723360 n=1 Tax=Ruditapes philippinarum TaxID=129788 RepID=UPI00295B9F6F